VRSTPRARNPPAKFGSSHVETSRCPAGPNPRTARTPDRRAARSRQEDRLDDAEAGEQQHDALERTEDLRYVGTPNGVDDDHVEPEIREPTHQVGEAEREFRDREPEPRHRPDRRDATDRRERERTSCDRVECERSRAEAGERAGAEHREHGEIVHRQRRLARARAERGQAHEVTGEQHPERAAQQRGHA
jgi:hypothetical protein